jgi:hypothetical protein
LIIPLRELGSRTRCYIADVGVIGASLFDDDIAADVRGMYSADIEQGIDDKEALRRILKRYQRLFGRQEGVGALVGFAVTQSELGRLDPSIRDQAIAAIDGGGDLELWQRTNPEFADERRAILADARALLTAPQPRRLAGVGSLRSSRKLSDLAAGDVLALDNPPFGVAIFRVVRVDQAPAQELPVLEKLEYSGSDVLPVEVLERLPRYVPFCNHANPEDWDLGGLHIRVMSNPSGWKRLGFRKAGRIQQRKGDLQKPVRKMGHLVVSGLCGANWSHILAYCRKSLMR